MKLKKKIIPKHKQSDSQTEVVDDGGIAQFGGCLMCLMLLWQIKQALNANDGITCLSLTMIFVHISVFRQSSELDAVRSGSDWKRNQNNEITSVGVWWWIMCPLVITNDWSLSYTYKLSIIQSVEMFWIIEFHSGSPVKIALVSVCFLHLFWCRKFIASDQSLQDVDYRFPWNLELFNVLFGVFFFSFPFPFKRNKNKIPQKK